jgi:amino acid adenylation domain-containing protein
MVKRYALTYAQKLLLSEQLYDIDSSHLNIGGYLLVQGKMNPVLFEHAVNLVCEENEILRTIFVLNSDGDYFQEVRDATNEVVIKDFSMNVDADKSCIEWIQKRFYKPFQVNGGNLYEIGLLLVGEKSYFYSIYNHLIADGWSVALAAKKIVQKYELLLYGKSIVVDNNCSFFDAQANSKEYINSLRYKADRQYWRDKAKGIGDYSCDISYKKREKKVSNSISRELEISQDLYSDVVAFCKGNNLVTFHFFLAIFLLIVKLRTGENKVLLNVRVQNRSSKKERECLGSFSSIIPLVANLDSENIFNIFALISTELMKNYRHRRCCMDEFYPSVVVEGNSDLGGAMVVSYEPFDYNYSISGFEVEAFTLSSGSIADSLDIHIREYHKNNRVFISMYFDKNLFDETEADIFVEQFKSLVNRVVGEGISEVKPLLLITNFEKSILDKMNDTDRILSKDNLCSVLDDVFFANTSSIAVVCSDRKYPYSELLIQSYKVAGYLQSLEICCGDRVAVVMDYSFDMIAVMTGIVLCGAVFVPISNKDPIERIGKIVSDSKAAMIVTDNLIDLACEQFLINTIYETDKKFDKSKVVLSEKDPCYIVYTSGSTGEPKGVINTHIAVINVLDEWIERYKIVGEPFVLLQTSSFAHDVFIGNYLKTIATGGTLVLPTDEERHDLNKLSILLENNKVNTLDSTPSLISMLVDYIERVGIDDSSIKLIIVGSDICSLEDFRRLFVKYKDRATVINSYGVSESAIYSTDYSTEVDEELPVSGNLPIGRPFRNTKMYVLNDEFKPVNIGSVGELFIAGYGLAEGYTSLELSKAKFLELEGLGRVYRTGDLVRILSDGNIQFIGRKDFQIKIRGYRIEPGEIEACIEKFVGITKAVVVTTLINGNKVLVAYYSSQKEISIDELVLRIRLSLPSYMIPNFFQRIEEIPLSSNGKVDRKTLMAMRISVPAHNTNVMSSDDDKKCVQDVWEKILGERFVSSNGFIGMGGDSLEAIRIASELNVLGYKCSYLDIYKSFSFDDFFSTYIIDKKIEEISIANHILEKVFGEGVLLQNIHHEILKKRIVELKIPIEKQFLDAGKIVEFCHDRFGFKIQPQYIFNREYQKLGEDNVKDLLSDLFRKESRLFNEMVLAGSSYRLTDPLYSADLRKFYRNKYFVSKIRLDEIAINDTQKAVKELMNKNDLLRACLVKTGLGTYAWEVFSECNQEIPVLDLSSYEVFSSYDFIYNVMSAYYTKKNDLRRFLFRAVIIKINLSETYLWYFMDESIHDDYGNQLIDKYLLEVARNGYREYQVTAKYMDYLSRFMVEKHIKEEDISFNLSLDEFRNNTEIYNSFLRKKLEAKSSQENFRYSFNVPNNINDEFSLALEVFIVFARQEFPFTKVPIALLHNTRFFSSEEFTNSIGAFIDEVPIIIDTELSVEDNLSNVRSRLEFINQNGIHFKNILLNPKMKNTQLRQKVRKIVGKLTDTDRLLLFNFKQGDIQIDEILSESGDFAINRWLYGISFSITIVAGLCEVYIRFPYSIDVSTLKSKLDLKFAEITGQE